MDKKWHIFNWVLGFAIPSEVLAELLEKIYDDVTNIEHIININLEIGNPPFLKTSQCLIIILHPFNKSGVWRVHKELLRPLTTNYILIVTVILIGISLELGYHTKKNLWLVGQQVYPCRLTVSPTVLDCTGIFIYQLRDNKGISHVIGHYMGLFNFI